MRINKNVRRLEAYMPGEQPRSKDVVKLNTNENPYPPSPACAEVLKKFNLDRLRRYPDPVFTELRDAIAKRHGTRPENVFVGNGSDEILYLATRAFVEDDETIGSLDPSYSLYKTLAAIRNVKWLGFDADVITNPLDRTMRQAKVALFLWTNPNAPTGTLVAPHRIATFASRFKGVVIVDEAYADFASANCMSLATARSNQNLIVMRTFSKSYSLAGMRVGYCIGPKLLIEMLYKLKDSYNVDAVAQSVALAAFNDQKWMQANVVKVVKTRQAFAKELTQRGWDVMPSESNFLFAKPAHKKAIELFDALRRRSIFVRYFKTQKTSTRLRITIGTDAQMKKLLAAIDELDR